MFQQRKRQHQSVKFQNNLSVYVAGLPAQTTYWDLRHALAKFGEIQATFVSSLKQYQTHKYGFGCFKSLEALEMALVVPVFVHGVKVSVIQRSEKDWKTKDRALDSPQPLEEEELDLVVAKRNSDAAEGARPARGYPMNNENIETAQPASPFAHPPEFTEFVHDTLASRFCTPRMLQAAMMPHRALAPGPRLGLTAGTLATSLAMAGDGHAEIADMSGNTIAHNVGIASIGSSSSGRVARVEGVPASWEAVDLFKFLSDHGAAVTAVLIYDDFDERGLRQGLVQFQTVESAERLCDVGHLQALNICLRFVLSSIQSIGPIRRSYGGEFSAYTHEMHNPEEYGYSVAEPVEPSAEASIKVASRRVSMTIWPPNLCEDCTSNSAFSSAPSSPATEPRTPCEELYTPGTVVGCDSPVPKDIAVHYSCNAVEEVFVESQEQQELSVVDGDCATSFFMAKEGDSLAREVSEKATGYYLTRTNNGKTQRHPKHQYEREHGNHHEEHQHPQPRMAPFCGPPQMPLMLPKASQTVVVDNFDSRLIGDNKNLAHWVSQFGEVYSVDLVPLGDFRTRAYISYMSPLDAQYTMHHLQMCVSGSFRLIVRLA